MVDEWDAADDAGRIGTRPHTVGEHFAVERPLLAPLPDEAFETGTWLTPHVDRFSQVTVRTNRYSVPVRLVGRQVRVHLHASDLVIYDGRNPVARHERLMAKSRSRLNLDHYLEALLRKPGALPGATALEQARAAGRFTPVHDAWWEAVRRVHGDAAGTRALIEVLLLHRHMPHDHVAAGLATAVRAGALTADAVALEVRKFAETDDHRAPDGSTMRHPAGNVLSLTERRLAQLPPTGGRCPRSPPMTSFCAIAAPSKGPRHDTPPSRPLTPPSTPPADFCGCPPSDPSSPTWPRPPPAIR
ncbi:hypothetical protein [Actinoplanes sp. TFC3]|uniref:Mu transposase domain-containing protein n=1 Tax=Actinoplanes sp. TFC3 TaxID=1710355 RepID=UPI00082BC08D|nr:hypothetical protein [Actinoplanes sp. TFC3]